MKECDYVKIMVEEEKYAKFGVHNGMIGWICDPRIINEQRLVSFEDKDGNEIAMIPVKEVDLELIWEAPVMQVGSTVLLFDGVYKRLGLTRGIKGVIVKQCEQQDTWVVRFEKQDGLAQAIELTLNSGDMAIDPNSYD